MIVLLHGNYIQLTLHAAFSRKVTNRVACYAARLRGSQRSIIIFLAKNSVFDSRAQTRQFMSLETTLLLITSTLPAMYVYTRLLSHSK